MLGLFFCAQLRFTAAFRVVKGGLFLAHQGIQEGSGTCNFFSNGYCSQVLCMWTGVVELGAGMCHDEVAYRHLSFASCRYFSVIFHSQAKYTQCFCAVATAAAEVFTTLLCSHVPNIMLASHRVNLRALTSLSGEHQLPRGLSLPKIAPKGMATGTEGFGTGQPRATKHSALSHGDVW